MRRRQTASNQWLIVLGACDRKGLATAYRLRPGAGVVLLAPISACDGRRLRIRGVTILEEPRTAIRVHNARELRRALLARTERILLSPIYPTASHPDWSPIPRMRAAALARLGKRKLLALGGMDARKYARIRRLGFQGWAGISAFRT